MDFQALPPWIPFPLSGQALGLGRTKNQEPGWMKEGAANGSEKQAAWGQHSVFVPRQ